MKKKSLMKNAFYKIILNFFNLMLPIIIGPYVYRTLGAESIGSVKFAESIFNYFFIFASFGIYQYGIRELSRIKNDKQKVSQMFSSLFVLSLVTNFGALLVFFIVTYLGYGQDVIFPILMVLSINFILNIFYVEWINEAFEDYDFITIKTIVVKIFYVVLLFTFVNHSDDYLIFALLLVFSTLLNNIISFIYVKRKVKFHFKNITIKKHLRPLFLVVIFSNANVLYSQLDRFLLGEFVNDVSVSYYAMSQQIMTLINAIMIGIIQVTIPRLSFLQGENSEEVYLSLLNRVVKIYFTILFPASIGLFVISDIGVVVYGGQEFVNAGPVLAVFSLYMITVGIESILANQVIYIKQREKILVYFIFLCGFINLFLDVLLIQLNVFTALTAIITTAVANVILVCLEYYYIRRVIKVPIALFDMTKMKYLFYALLFVPVAYAIRMVITGTFESFFVIIFISAILYLLILIFTKDEILTILIDKVKARVKK
ncbi:oligosaccharide flippase family protein [Cytobacillus gottheilii]|uniref:oligosaccharide flippase family protein n=1 Tax=Cytobacillus gottheilii TaxID=859144 RepID=UPI0009BB80A4|nr:oligosaccharide flippase family protein [Cytobacillus gottheilii]